MTRGQRTVRSTAPVDVDVPRSSPTALAHCWTCGVVVEVHTDGSGGIVDCERDGRGGIRVHRCRTLSHVKRNGERGAT